MDNYSEKIVTKLAGLRVKNANRLNKVKRQFANKYQIGMISNADILAVYNDLLKKNKIKQNPDLENLLKKRKIRTLSGVAPVAVLTKPYPCPGKCIYCPTEKDMPKSYLSNEPAVMRAIRTKFDPWVQVTERIRALTENGHNTDKIELIIMGGTWSYFPKKYQNWFVKRCFDACNLKTAKNIAIAHKWNESAKHRIVALTLETRPDYIDEKEIKYWRALGATKVELGVQTVNPKVLKFINRGHGVEEIVRATTLLKQAGFKIAYHMMPGLPLTTPATDLKNYETIFHDPRFQPDMLKIYPTVVTKNSKLYSLWKKGKYIPYNEKQLFDLLIKIKQSVPEYVRIIRLIRDIPKESIMAGNTVTNLREILQQEFKKTKKFCRCIRCREAREDIKDLKKATLSIIKYPASDATEYFLQYTSPNHRKLYAFLRLRLPKGDETNFIKKIADSAMIREVHTYGKLIALKKSTEKGIQHLGFGTRLTNEAEKISRKAGFTKIAVISGVGVRGFYKKLGYRLQGTYMVKSLKHESARTLKQ